MNFKINLFTQLNLSTEELYLSTLAKEDLDRVAQIYASNNGEIHIELSQTTKSGLTESITYHDDLVNGLMNLLFHIPSVLYEKKHIEYMAFTSYPCDLRFALLGNVASTDESKVEITLTLENESPQLQSQVMTIPLKEFANTCRLLSEDLKVLLNLVEAQRGIKKNSILQDHLGERERLAEAFYDLYC